jgi:sRNA-binding carbon storage regulator CsrA
MLVLSRRLGECIVIDDDLVVTVGFLGEDHVELSVTRLDGSFLRSVVAQQNESVTIVDGLEIVAVAIKEDRVRLGIQTPPDTRVERRTFWGSPG